MTAIFCILFIANDNSYHSYLGVLFIFNCLCRPSTGILFMSKFNLRPISIALLGITTTSVFANSKVESDATQQLSTIV
ncbi:MAG: hypothetical protein AAB326_02370, partial [Pseudomonadota bacterium]